ncbi:MAG: helix-turn-helix domain-containing protein, partial [Candidatus Methanomethylicaceae archaeon]
ALERVLQEKINDGSPRPYDEIVEYVQRYIVNKTMERYENNQVKAASVLGISRTTLRKKAKIDQ